MDRSRRHNPPPGFFQFHGPAYSQNVPQYQHQPPTAFSSLTPSQNAAYQEKLQKFHRKIEEQNRRYMSRKREVVSGIIN